MIHWKRKKFRVLEKDQDPTDKIVDRILGELRKEDHPETEAMEEAKRQALDLLSGMRDGDAVIFFNFRPDRAREITRALVDPDFDGFTRQFFPVTFVCNTEYDASMPNVEVAFPRVTVQNGLGEYLSQMGMTQLRIAETEKYAHVTFFFNGGVEEPDPGEERILVKSPKVDRKSVV